MSSDRPPLRLLDPDASTPDFVRSTLEAARADVPGAPRIERIARRLPLGAGPAGGGVPPPATPASTLSGALIGGLLGVAVVAASTLWQAAAPAPPVTVSSAVVAPEAPRAEVDPSPRPATSAEPVPRMPVIARPPVIAPVESATAAPAPSDGVTEIVLLQRAQDAVGGAPARALELLNEHLTRFPGGALSQEREVLAISALLRLGRTAEARTRAARFALAYPSSAHRRRIEALLPDSSDHKDPRAAPLTP